MDAHSSSLLSPDRAPTELADERSALSQQYSDTVSNVQDQSKRQHSDGSSLRPLRSPAETSQEGQSELTDEVVLLESLLTDLKNLGYYDLLKILFRKSC